MESRFHPPEEFVGKFGSKHDLYKLLTIDSKRLLQINLKSGPSPTTISQNFASFYEGCPIKEEIGIVLIIGE